MLAADNESNTPGVRSELGGVGDGDSGDVVSGGGDDDGRGGMMLYVVWCVLEAMRDVE